MASRREAKVPPSLWTDPFFRALGIDPQWLYLGLITSPDLMDTGVTTLLPRRWSLNSAEAEPDRLLTALHVLHTEGLVFADYEMQEVFVSGYYEIERIAKQPRRVVGVQDRLARLHSDEIAAFASAELSALMAAEPEPVPRGLRAVVLERDGWRCLRCHWKPGDVVPAKNGRPLYRGLEIDHIHPKSKGGSDELSNLQVLCTTCNASKGARV